MTKKNYTDPSNLAHVTESGIPVDEVYGPWSLHDDWSHDERVGMPGEPPFARGPDRDMYRDQPWIMAMYSGFSTPEDTNQRFRELIAAGQTGFSIALDLPTQIGMDSDNPIAEHEVGKVGVPIDSLRDMEILLDGIDLQSLRQIRTTANSIAPMIMAMILCVAEQRGVQPDQFRVLFQNDSLKEYVVRGTYIFPPGAAVRLSTDVIEWCGKFLPLWTPISVCGGHYREAGSTAIQELAYSLSDAIVYLDAARQRGTDLTSMVRTIWFFFNAHSGLLEEVAKFRAARRMWDQLLRDRYGIEDPSARALRVIAYTGGSTLTRQEPLNNAVRVTLNTLAAALGGIQTLGSSSYDEAVSLPSDEAALLSLRTQQIVAYESGVTLTADPLAGSYYVEWLTDETQRLAEDEMEVIAEMGGAVEAIQSGYMRQEVAESAYRWERDLEEGRRFKVGVNAFRRENAAELDIAAFRTSPEARRRQSEKLERLRGDRDQSEVERSLAALGVAAQDPQENLIPAMKDCFAAYATLGEVTESLRTVFGTYEQGVTRPRAS